MAGAGITETPQQHRTVVNVPSVCRYIEWGTDRPSVVVVINLWQCCHDDATTAPYGQFHNYEMYRVDR